MDYYEILNQKDKVIFNGDSNQTALLYTYLTSISFADSLNDNEIELCEKLIKQSSIKLDTLESVYVRRRVTTRFSYKLNNKENGKSK
jgi:hypothetical protein